MPPRATCLSEGRAKRNGTGAVTHRGRSAGASGATMGKCVRCGKRTRVAPGSWSDGPRPKCSKCGGELDPSARALPGITGP